MTNRESSDVKTLAAEIAARMRALVSPRTADIRALRREFSKQISKAPAKEVFELALLLLNRATFEHRFVAYELVCYHRPALQSLGAKELEQLGEGLDRWEAVDTFASYLSGPAWREHQVPDSLIHRWARSKDRWWRRAAVVSTVPLNSRAQGGRGDAPRTLAVCAMLAGDRDPMVGRAISWALRELAKRHPIAVQAFLARHCDRLPALVLREVRNKLTTGLKNPGTRARRTARLLGSA
jgi:3-methyladenine DNA glycosylase AlkD